jgi:hypothetical protein
MRKQPANWPVVGALKAYFLQVSALGRQADITHGWRHFRYVPEAEMLRTFDWLQPAHGKAYAAQLTLRGVAEILVRLNASSLVKVFERWPSTLIFPAAFATSNTVCGPPSGIMPSGKNWPFHRRAYALLPN